MCWSKHRQITPLPYVEFFNSAHRRISAFNDSNCVNLRSDHEYVVDKDLILSSNVILSEGKLLMTVTGDLIMERGSKIDLDGKGHLFGEGPSPGASVDGNHCEPHTLLDLRPTHRPGDISGYWFAGGAAHATKGQNGWRSSKMHATFVTALSN